MLRSGNMNVLKSLSVIVFMMIMLISQSGFAQNINSLAGKDLSKVKVDDLSDEQVVALLNKAKESGYTIEQLKVAAKLKGMLPTEIEKLSNRIESLKNDQTVITEKLKGRSRTELTVINNFADRFLGEEEDTKDSDLKKIFGYSLFNSENLTFEPSVNVATPMNYQLGPGDNVIIDIWGASQETYEEEITPEGYVVLSNVGPVYLNGLTIEDANLKLKKALSSIYAGLFDGSTFLKLSLGTLRSIKVNIVGDVNVPGSYTLTSLATVFNALYVAGGPSVNGTLRNVKVIRDNKTLATLDIYDFLLKGVQKNNVRLQDQDIVFVSPYSTRVEVSGEIKRPGYYDMLENETLKSLITYSGNYTGKAYSRWIKVVRKNGEEKKVFDVSFAEQDSFKLANGDVINIDTVLDKYENKVEIKGAVYRPGIFAIDGILSLKQLIKKAEGLRGDEFDSRISIYRTNADLTIEVIPMDLYKIMNSNEDFQLVKDDIVLIPSIFDVREDYTVTISGEVIKPGKYPFTENTSVEDLILKAGGLKESASLARVEIARRIKDNTATETTNSIAQIIQFSIRRDLVLSDSSSKTILQPFDQVFIRCSPGYTAQALIKIDGEVTFPGYYSLTSTNERISDILKRAGNLTSYAYPKGARLLRKVSANKMRMKDLEKLADHAGDSTEIVFDEEAETTISINLEKILKKPGSVDDLFLKEGDQLVIPKELQTVSLTGAVLYPVTIPYIKGKSLKNYILRAGGKSDESRPKRSYVIYANGSVKSTKGFIVFRHYPRVEPGSTIVVPKKLEKKGLSTSETISLGTAISSMALIIITIINAVK